jgi:CMP-N,N'-diacetyllegionaminic acid synthase
MTTKLAIIPARGGSKGIINKNLKLFDDKPLIQYTIEAALKSNIFDKVIVSSDSEDILKYVRNFNIETPFIRPSHLGGDNVLMKDVVIHALNWLEQYESFDPDIIYLLQPTSPLRTYRHIIDSYNLFKDSSADTLVSVVKVPHNFTINSMMRIQNNRLKKVNSLEEIPLRQEKEIFYSRNGAAIYCFRKKYFIENKKFFDDDTIPFIMDKISSIDIDDIDDFILAELIYKSKLF